MLARDAHGGALVALNHVPSNAEHSREVVFAKAKGTPLPSEAAPHMSIDRRHSRLAPGRFVYVLIANTREQTWVKSLRCTGALIYNWHVDRPLTHGSP